MESAKMRGAPLPTGGAMIPAERLVNLLELLRTYAQVYVESIWWLGANLIHAYGDTLNDETRAVLLAYMVSLRDECERVGLPMTLGVLQDAIRVVDQEPKTKAFSELLSQIIWHICDTLRRELARNIFLKIDPDLGKYYAEPLHGWEQICLRFDAAPRDVEEMNKCFALSRYNAAMFHALHVAEVGAIALGDYLRVTDPKKGWNVTERKLKELVNAGHKVLPRYLRGKFDFLEQIHREIHTMMLAWRHKVDHAANQLVIVPNAEFTPDVAKHIMDSVKVFMMRLDEGLPHGKKK